MKDYSECLLAARMTLNKIEDKMLDRKVTESVALADQLVDEAMALRASLQAAKRDAPDWWEGKPLMVPVVGEVS